MNYSYLEAWYDPTEDVNTHLATTADTLLEELNKHPHKTAWIQADESIRAAVMANLSEVTREVNLRNSGLSEEIERIISDNELCLEDKLDDVVDATHDNYAQEMWWHANQIAYKLSFDDVVAEDEVTLDDLIASVTGEAISKDVYKTFLKYNAAQKAKADNDADYFPLYEPLEEQLPMLAYNEITKLFPHQPIKLGESVWPHEITLPIA